MIAIPPTFLDQVDSLIQENIGEDLSTEQLADLICLSSSQVYRKIKQKTGYSPSVYIRNKRLEEGIFLIRHSDLTLSQIAYSVGFSCLSYFSSSFSAYYGYPPSELRFDPDMQ